MAAINLHYPKMKVFQLSSTQVASGAKIYTYEAGTSTDKATYSDQALTTANANPVIADSNGEAQVWLLDDELYKIVINDSDDVLISSTDDIGSTGATTATDGAYNKLVNGSFEDNTGDNGTPSNWDLSITGASTIDIDTSDQIHGLAALQFVGGASGAGTATTSGFFEVQASKEIAIRFALKASLASVGNTVKFLWYTSVQAPASVGSSTVYNVTATAPTSWVEEVRTATPGSDVKYGKIQISGSASATELPVDIAGEYHDITGTTTITSLEAVRVGTLKRLHFDSTLTLTHDASNLVLPNGKNITTSAGDEAEFIEYSTGDWRCLRYMRYEYPLSNTHDHGYDASLAAWTVATDYVVDQVVQSTTPDGIFYFKCTTAGTSHASTEPVWPTRDGDTIAEATGTVVWEAIDGSGGNIEAYSLASSVKTWVEIETQTANVDADIQFTEIDTTTYKKFWVRLRNVRPVTNSVQLSMHLGGTGASPTYSQTAYYWHNYESTSGSAVYAGRSGANSTFLGVSGTIGYNAADGFSTDIFLSDLDSTVQNTIVTWTGGQAGSGTSHSNAIGSGHLNSAYAKASINFQMSSGNISLGEFTLYGLRE